MTSRGLAQLLALALAALTYWTIVSRPGVIGDEFPIAIYFSILVFTLFVFGVSFLALRLGAGGSATYWSMENRDQLRSIGWMIVTISAVMLVGHAILDRLDRAAPLVLRANFFVAMTLVPAAFIVSGRVRWPSRSAHPGRFALLLLCLVGLGAAAAWSWMAWSSAPGEPAIPSPGRLLFVVPVVILAATLEEIVFRVLLQTALLERTGSRFLAVFLSSVAFGLMHVPGQFAEPVMHADWTLLQLVAHDYAPGFLLQIAFGLLLGVLWLRTGSLVLISGVHALLNMGGVLATGL